MKRFLIIFLALILAACTGAPATATQPPAALQPEPTQTAVVVVITATSAPAEEPTAEPLPTYTALPTYTVPAPPTEAPAQPAATEAVSAPPTEVAPAGDPGVITVDDALGKGWFLSMTRSRNDFSLRCQLNKEITFTVKVTSDDIKQVDLWYRMEDRSTGAIFDWVNVGKMIPDNTGGYTYTLSGEKINPNFRKPNAWFDYQFVGYNATGVVGRSEKIERQVSYTFDCP